MIELFTRLPLWAKVLLLVGVATGIATYASMTYLPSPMAAMLEEHIDDGKRTARLMWLLCRELAKTESTINKCDDYMWRNYRGDGQYGAR